VVAKAEAEGGGGLTLDPLLRRQASLEDYGIQVQGLMDEADVDK